MRNLKRQTFIAVAALVSIAGIIILRVTDRQDVFTPQIGQPVDSLNGVLVFYNGMVSNSSGRNLATDGYNIGLKYQCVEFVKRYYYQHLGHKMPHSYGHAKDFFDKSLNDGELNKPRNLIQYRNPGKSKPMVGDIVVYDGNNFNPYGHVAIVSEVRKNFIEIIQQNTGPIGKSRATIRLSQIGGNWILEDKALLGWLRKE